MKHLIFILLLIPIVLKAQEPGRENLSQSIEKDGVITLAKDWKYKAGDDLEWANPNFNDSSWQTFSLANLFNKKIQKKAKKTNIIWYRKWITIDSTTTQKLVAYISQSGASEIYLDGELIHSLGKVSSNPDSIVRCNPATAPLSFPMKINKEQVLAIRFADTKKKFSLFKENTGLLKIRVQKENSVNDPLFVASDSLFDKDGIIKLGYREDWRFQPGDDLNWANPDFDDSNWMFYIPAGLTEPIPDSLWNGYGWFRYRFAADSSAYAKVTHLYFSTWGAAEVYLDGKPVQKYGAFSTDMKGEKRYTPEFKTYPAVVLRHGESHVLAVRYSYHKGPHYKKLLGKIAPTFGFDIGLTTDNLNQLTNSDIKIVRQFVDTLGSMLFLIVLLHIFLFVLFPAERSNLYIAIVASLLFLNIITAEATAYFELDVLQKTLFSTIPFIISFMAALSMFPFTISSIFNQKPRLMHKMLIWLFPVVALAPFILSSPVPFFIIFTVFVSGVLFFSSRVLIQALRNKQKGVWFVAGGFIGLIVSLVAFIFYSIFSQNFKEEINNVLAYMAYLSFPIGLTAFMASRFRDLYTHLEQKVVERTQALNQSLDELRSTQAQLIQSEKMASLGQLTAGIAHEIQNPLNFVNNFSEINKELIVELKEELAVGNRQSAEEIANDIMENELKINHHGKRADAIVKGMLQHSRSNSGHKEPTDINALTDEYLRLSYHGMRAKDKSFTADFKTEFDPNLPKLNVVPQEIGRVLLNLINNAFYAAPLPPTGGFKNPNYIHKPTVTIRTSSFIPPAGGPRGAVISVIDNGPGIPASIVDKIFQPFFTTKPTGQGTGLGLSLAYDIVKAHGGELKVETKEGEGSEFIIQIPLN